MIYDKPVPVPGVEDGPFWEATAAAQAATAAVPELRSHLVSALCTCPRCLSPDRDWITPPDGARSSPLRSSIGPI